MTRKITWATKLRHLFHSKYASDRCRICRYDDLKRLKLWNFFTRRKARAVG